MQEAVSSGQNAVTVNVEIWFRHGLSAYCSLPTAFLAPAPLPKETGRIDSLNYRRLSHVKWPEERLKKWKAAIIPASKLT